MKQHSMGWKSSYILLIVLIIAVLAILLAAMLWYPPLQYNGTVKDEAGQPFRQMVDGKIDLNSASVEELMVLPGIGEGRAEEIVKYREAHGGFAGIETLLEIKGIGEKTLEGLRELVRAG